MRIENSPRVTAVPRMDADFPFLGRQTPIRAL